MAAFPCLNFKLAPAKGRRRPAPEAAGLGEHGVGRAVLVEDAGALVLAPQPGLTRPAGPKRAAIEEPDIEAGGPRPHYGARITVTGRVR